MQTQYRVLVIIPKTTQTMFGIFHNERCIFKDTIIHQEKLLSLEDQIIIRKKLILECLHQAGINVSKLDAVSASGGLLRAVEGGTYLVDDPMRKDLSYQYNGKHASNLGGLLASVIADGLHIPAFIVDPPVVDEMSSLARYSGLPSVERKSIFHALNQKAKAREAAKAMQSKYEEVNLIVAHIGNGITIGAHQKGKVIDVNNGLHGDGPFSLERAGTIPSRALIDLCYSGTFTKEEMIHEVTYRGGLRAYLPHQGLSDVEATVLQENQEVKSVTEAMCYQIAKEIGSMAVVLQGDVDGIVITGPFAHSSLITNFITKRTNWIADVFIYPGESDLEAINAGTLRVLKTEEQPKRYGRNDLEKGEGSV